MKIYTRTGDTGTTSLGKKGRAKKNHPLLEIYGTLDELNALVGCSCSFLSEDEFLIQDLRKIQSLLFSLGTEIAFPDENRKDTISEKEVLKLENHIDHYSEKLPELKNFILPGGTKSASFLHLARTVCRRLERLMIAHGELSSGLHLIWINRLSDYFFTAARLANALEKKDEILWRSGN